jgi:hypothetical protein
MIENFKPSVTGEVLGENWRSYRRGCERRFVSGLLPIHHLTSLLGHSYHPDQLLQFLYWSEHGKSFDLL